MTHRDYTLQKDRPIPTQPPSQLKKAEANEGTGVRCQASGVRRGETSEAQATSPTTGLKLASDLAFQDYFQPEAQLVC